MRVRITLTDQHGQTFEGELELAPVSSRRGLRAHPQAHPAPIADARIDFSLPRRAFLKKHARGSGPRRFAVLLAHMTQGKTTVRIAREAIEKEWTRNKGVLGGDFRPMYTTRAKEKGWSDSIQRGSFVLRAEWRGALGK